MQRTHGSASHRGCPYRAPLPPLQGAQLGGPPGRRCARGGEVSIHVEMHYREPRTTGRNTPFVPSNNGL